MGKGSPRPDASNILHLLLSTHRLQDTDGTRPVRSSRIQHLSTASSVAMFNERLELVGICVAGTFGESSQGNFINYSSMDVMIAFRAINIINIIQLEERGFVDDRFNFASARQPMSQWV